MTERRAARRYDLSLPVIIRIPVMGRAVSRSGQTRDVSTRGVYFVLDSDVIADSPLDMTMTLPTEVASRMEVFVRAVGRVVRVEKLREDSNQRVGVAAMIERYEITRNEPVVS
jgi:hypothetical protein